MAADWVRGAGEEAEVREMTYRPHAPSKNVQFGSVWVSAPDCRGPPPPGCQNQISQNP